MASKYRVVTAKGKCVAWTDEVPMEVNPWVREDLVDAWREAGSRGFKSCAKAAEICQRMGWSEHEDLELLGLAPEQAAEVSRRLAARRASEKAARPMWSADTFASWWKGAMEAHRAQEAREAFPETVRTLRWVGYPVFVWAKAGSSRTLLSSKRAKIALAACQDAHELGPASRRAMAELKKASPELDVQPPVLSDVSGFKGARLVEFEPVRQYGAANSFAVYTKRHDGTEGFFMSQGGLSTSLADARQFESEAEALKFYDGAIYAAGDVYCVEVKSSVVGYRPVEAKAASVESLDHALAALEGEALALALRDSRIEQLEAELARRKELADEASPSAAQVKVRL